MKYALARALTCLWLFSSLPAHAGSPPLYDLLPADCYEDSPSQAAGKLRDEQTGTALDAADRERLLEFLKRLMREREGVADGYYCKQDEGKVYQRSDIRLSTFRFSDTRFDFTVELQYDFHRSDHNQFSYTVGDDHFYYGRNQSGNGVVIHALNDSELVTVEKYLRRSAYGTPIVRETIRHYFFDNAPIRTTLIITNRYYINGHLQAENTWHLK